MLLGRKLPQVLGAIRHPDRAYNYAIINAKSLLLWDYYYNALREPKRRSLVPSGGPETPDAISSVHQAIADNLRRAGINVVDFTIDVRDYRQWVHQAQYGRYPGYYAGTATGNFAEKSLEHYLAARFLALGKGDVYIDVANANSPTPEVYREMYGCEVYRQDLVFPKGLRGNTIGGDACEMPVEDGFATKMALHCSFEHFEQDADIRLMREANRVLRNGGELCILPLYLSTEYAIQIDPTLLPRGWPYFESDAILHCSKWKYRHARSYDVPHLLDRIVRNLANLRLTIYVVQNEKEVDRSCYVKFIAVLRKEEGGKARLPEA